jgi:flagellar biosynthesis GTPase FlhF
VQVDPIKPKLKLPGATRLKLKLNCDILLPTSVLEFNLRRYIQEKRDQLPVNEFKTEILAQVAAHQVVLIAGATGCGKTTQVGPGS